MKCYDEVLSLSDAAGIPQGALSCLMISCTAAVPSVNLSGSLEGLVTSLHWGNVQHTGNRHSRPCLWGSSLNNLTCVKSHPLKAPQDHVGQAAASSTDLAIKALTPGLIAKSF